MKTSSLILIILATVMVVSLLAIGFTSSTQDFMVGNTMWNGLADFTTQNQVVQLDNLAGLSAQSDKSALVCIPYLEYSPADLALIKQFVDNGNTLILMDDFGYGNEVLQYLGVRARFDHRLLLDSLFCYKNQYLPRITDFTSTVKENGVASIVLNHATIIENVDSSQSQAWSSNASFLDTNRNGSQDPGEPAGPFVVAAGIPSGKGLLELVSDPALIINAEAGQNDNAKFVSLLIEHKAESGSLLLDRSHLSQSALDVYKNNLERLRIVFSNPYVLLGLMAVIFVVITCYTFRKGELFG